MTVENIFAKRQTAHWLRVKELIERIHKVNNLPTLPHTPSTPDDKTLEKQCKIIAEEFFELMEACGFDVVKNPDNPEKFTLLKRDKSSINLIEVAKESADVSVTVTGLLVYCGIADAALLEEVDANNLMKFGPGGYLYEHGKWRKPKDHPKPDIASLLIAQDWTRETSDGNNKV